MKLEAGAVKGCRVSGSRLLGSVTPLTDTELVGKGPGAGKALVVGTHQSSGMRKIGAFIVVRKWKGG